MRHILYDSLPADAGAALTALYALETALHLGWVTEDEIMPAFQVLFDLRDSADLDALSRIR